jgi:hypothetical protein
MMSLSPKNWNARISQSCDWLWKSETCWKLGTRGWLRSGRILGLGIIVGRHGKLVFWHLVGSRGGENEFGKMSWNYEMKESWKKKKEEENEEEKRYDWMRILGNEGVDGRLSWIMKGVKDVMKRLLCEENDLCYRRVGYESSGAFSETWGGFKKLEEVEIVTLRRPIVSPEIKRNCGNEMRIYVTVLKWEILVISIAKKSWIGRSDRRINGLSEKAIIEKSSFRTLTNPTNSRKRNGCWYLSGIENVESALPITSLSSKDVKIDWNKIVTKFTELFVER